jgi:hypothetical protein
MFCVLKLHLKVIFEKLKTRRGRVHPMISRSFKPIYVLFLSLAASLLAAPTMGEARALGTDSGSRADMVAELQANPRAIFSDADGKRMTLPALISNVRELTIAEKASLRPIVEALKLAAPDEKSAIGTGLGQAAMAVIKTDPPYAAEIQQALAETTDQVAILAFAAVTGNVPTGAVGSGGAGGVGGAGGSSVNGSPASGGGGATGRGGGGGGDTAGLAISTGAPFTVNAATLTLTTATNDHDDHHQRLDERQSLDHATRRAQGDIILLCDPFRFAGLEPLIRTARHASA